MQERRPNVHGISQLVDSSAVGFPVDNCPSPHLLLTNLAPTPVRIFLPCLRHLNRTSRPTGSSASSPSGAIVLGCFLGLIFAASSVYLALKVGLTVSASIPIAVLSITIFRAITRAMGNTEPQILRNNIVQTTGSAGESVAAGVVFTLPALLLLGYALPWSKVAAIAIVGGLLGVLLMIPLRHALIVKEHDTLKYPEGTAGAEVLIVGEERGVQARTVFMGFGLGALYKFLNSACSCGRTCRRRSSSGCSPRGRPSSSARSAPRSAPS